MLTVHIGSVYSREQALQLQTIHLLREVDLEWLDAELIADYQLIGQRDADSGIAEWLSVLAITGRCFYHKYGRVTQGKSVHSERESRTAAA